MPTTETVVYIHGVSPFRQTSHQQQYQDLHDAIRRNNPAFPPTFCPVEWGWNPGNGASHQLLNDAEESLGGRAIAAVQDPSDFTLNPLRIAVEKFRPLMIYNFSDMFYYASHDGKNAVRYAAAHAITTHLADALRNPDALVSLTLIAHSAGSVAAFDLLFYLFFAPRPVQDFIDPDAIKAGPSDSPEHLAAAATTPTTAPHPTRKAKTLEDLRQLKHMAQAGRLRVRRLFTFGSPITPLAFRSDALLALLAKPDGRLRAADYGLTASPAAFPDPLPPGPRWVNFWDKDDPIAWPVEPLMDAPRSVVLDQYVDVADDVTAAHNAYWTNEEFQQRLASAW